LQQSLAVEQDVDLRRPRRGVDHAQGGVGFGAFILRPNRARLEREEGHDERQRDEHLDNHPCGAP
jgi:hypothetical protein